MKHQKERRYKIKLILPIFKTIRQLYTTMWKPLFKSTSKSGDKFNQYFFKLIILTYAARDCNVRDCYGSLTPSIDQQLQLYPVLSYPFLRRCYVYISTILEPWCFRCPAASQRIALSRLAWYPKNVQNARWSFASRFSNACQTWSILPKVVDLKNVRIL